MAGAIIMNKIRIGYVLKSADVRTQVSSRYSENSSQTHPCTSAHTQAHPQIPTYTHAQPHTYLNHIKLHVNRPNTKKARSKKKEKRRNKSSLRQSAD